MSRADWNALLPNREAIESMSSEQLKDAAIAAECHGTNICFGIAAIGTLLAGAALNEERGLNPDAVADLGWLLESLGKLSAKLADTGSGIAIERKRRNTKREG